jgi:UDP-glucose 4-epimerase
MPVSLVTGGAGFIGSHVAQHLLTAGHQVVVLDDLSGGFAGNVPAAARLVNGSVLDHRLLEELFAKNRFDYVYHLAAYAAEGLSHYIKRFNYANNLIGTVNLINASVNHAVKCFVFTSSIAVYGAAPSPMTEQTPTVPVDPYGIAKLAAEQELRVSRQHFGLDYVNFRPHNVYGERQNVADPYRNVIGIFMNQLLRGEPMTIFGDGQQQRAFTHVADVAPLIAGCVDVAAARNQTFNIGADVPTTVNELARLVAEAMGVECRTKHLPARNEVKVAFSDHSKLDQVFGRRPKTALRDGLRAMALWVREQGPRKGRPFEEVEIRRNFPPAWRNLAPRS